MDSQPSATPYRLGFIGGGKLAGSVIRGLVRAKFCAPGLILVSEPNDATRRVLEHELGITGTAENAEVAEKSEIIFVGVKPSVVVPGLNELARLLERKLLASLSPGLRVRDLGKT